MYTGAANQLHEGKLGVLDGCEGCKNKVPLGSNGRILQRLQHLLQVPGHKVLLVAQNTQLCRGKQMLSQLLVWKLLCLMFHAGKPRRML